MNVNTAWWDKVLQEHLEGRAAVVEHTDMTDRDG